jgi:DNA-binding transcriptional ArsR family regulator
MTSTSMSPTPHPPPPPVQGPGRHRGRSSTAYDLSLDGSEFPELSGSEFAGLAHFRPQVEGDLVRDGVCAVLLAEKLGVSQPTLSEHMGVLGDAQLVQSKRIKRWTFYKRDERRIQEIKKLIVADL